MPSVIVAGAGLAGLATAAALVDSGFDVEVFESRPYLGGRAASYSIPASDGTSLVLDNCQHILLRCCVNLLDFYRRIGVSHRIRFYREFHWVEPGGRISVFRPGRFPAPAHFTESFLRLHFLTFSEKLAVARGMLAVVRERRSPDELDALSMAAWLAEQRQPERAIQSYWRQVLVSAVNEELEAMSAFHGLQVFRLGFLAGDSTAEMGVPDVTLGELYSILLNMSPRLKVEFRSGVASLHGSCTLTDGSTRRADYYVSAVPVERVGHVLPAFNAPDLTHSPITGVHLWFDRPVTELPHATLLDRSIQWMFNKGAGRYLQLVVSASRPFTGLSKPEIVRLCLDELAEFFPAARDARLLRAHVAKEMRATISVQPGTRPRRPGAATAHPNIFVAGDWTSTGWPSTMEGAVRSGYAAAEAVCAAAGRPARFLLPDVA